MKSGFKSRFKDLWKKHFSGSELPIGFYYANHPGDSELAKEASGRHRCLMVDLNRVRKGTALCFDKESIGCQGGVRSLGFPSEQQPDFESFLACGVPGKSEGIRYKKTPQLVRETQTLHPPFSAPENHIVFKPWDAFTENEHPDVVIFFAEADVLAGLFSLANFDRADPLSVIAPSCAGCASIVLYPYLEGSNESARCVMGMFDISARPYLQKERVSFAIPWNRFQTMVDHMESSFLITHTWERIRGRLNKPVISD